MRIVPEEGLRSPAATLSSVDLPHPVGPTIETNSPCPIARPTSFTAVYEPPPLREANVQVMCSKETAATAIYLYFAAAFFANELSKVFSSLIESPAAITDGSNCLSTL